MACKTKAETAKTVNEAFKGTGINPSSLIKYFNTNLEATVLQDGSPSVEIGYKSPIADASMQDALTTAISTYNAYMADLIVSTAEAGTPFSKEAATFIDTRMRENQYVGDLYANTLDFLTGTWAKNEQLQVIKAYAVRDKKWAGKFNKQASIRHDAQQKQVQELQKAEAGLSRAYNARYTTKEERANGFKILANSALFGIVNNGMLNRIVDGGELIADLIKEAEAALTTPNSTNTNIDTAEKLSMLYANEDLTGRKVKSNLEAEGYQQNGTEYKQMSALISLYTLRKATKPEEFLSKLYSEDKELYEGFISLTLAAKHMSDRLARQVHKDGNKEINVQKGNLIEDVGATDWFLQTVSYEQLANDPTLGEAYGFKVLRAPIKGGDMGIIKRENTGSMQQGITGNASYIKSGVPISTRSVKSMEEAEDMFITQEDVDKLVKTNSLFIRTNSFGGRVPALTLTAAERVELGYVQDPVMALVRSYAHNTMLAETQVARDMVAGSYTDSFKDIGTMEAVINIKMDKDEHPPLINVEDDFIYDKLSDKIKNKYRLVDKSVLSDVGGFKNTAKLVRKDLGEQLLGYAKGGLFGDNHQANLYHKRVKEVIRWAKIDNIVLNAPKIAMDLAAGMAVATAKGASIQEMVSYTKEAYLGVRRISKIRDKKANLLFKRAQTEEGSVAYNNVTKAIKLVDKELANDPFSAAHANGFIQSLGTQLILEDMQSPQGLQAVMEETIRKFMVDKDGKTTKLNEGIKKVARLGGEIGLEGLYHAAGDVVKNRLKGESEGDALKRFGDRLNRVKNQEDMTELVAELMAAPNSSLVQLGGAMTQMADLLPRWIIYKHNINRGRMTEEAAIEDALAALPDYKIALPSSLQFLSDLYLLPYPSFIVRAQYIIGNLMVRNSVSLVGQIMTESYLQRNFALSGANIVDANIIDKILENRVFSNPADLAAFPYQNLLGF